MGIFSLLFKKTVKHTEHELITEEINRSKRFGFNFGILVLELTQAAPYSLYRIIPGKIIAFEVIKRNLRLYDKIMGPFIKRYYILLPQTDKEGVKVIEDRIKLTAKEKKLDVQFIGKAIFPFDGKDTRTLLNKALGKI